MHERDAIADVCCAVINAAQKAMEGITLKSLVQENSATNPSVSLRRIGYYYGDRNKTAEAPMGD